MWSFVSVYASSIMRRPYSVDDTMHVTRPSAIRNVLYVMSTGYVENWKPRNGRLLEITTFTGPKLAAGTYGD